MDQKSLYRGKFLEMAALGKWEFVRRVSGGTQSPWAVGVVAITSDKQIILITQFRVPVGRTCVEIPAGLVGDVSETEGWKTAALRELREETGYAAADAEWLTEGPTSAGLTSELIALVRVTGVRYDGPPQPDGDEKIDVHVVPLAEVDQFLATRVAMGDLVDPKVYAALYFARSS